MTRLNRKAALSPDAKRAVAKAKAAEQERVFLRHLMALGLDAPIPEHRFHPERKWRWDYAYPASKLAIEVDGGVWVGGKHGRGSGIVKDHEKRNAGAVLGWRLLLVQPKQLMDPETARLVYRALTPDDT